MNVLAIGNSFSQDAMRYLHTLAALAGEDITCVNLYIGGCSLEKHYCNMLFDSKAYSLEFNGESTGFTVSVSEALASRAWDVITLQQASHLSDDFATYAPYIEKIACRVREACPDAKLMIHETWAYEEGSDRLVKTMGYASRDEMADRVHEAYMRAAEAVRADGVIPSGRVFTAMAKNGVGPVYRDTFHASKGVGRFALGMTWLEKLCEIADDKIGHIIEGFVPDEPAARDALRAVCEIVKGIK